MADEPEVGGATGGRKTSRRILSVGLLVAALTMALWVHLPACRLGFTGDDFQWWQHARMAVESPRLLFAAYGGYRPANTWTLALDVLLYGIHPRGYHCTNLALHLLASVMLWAALRRFGLGPVSRAAVAMLWACSPFTLETSVVVANRFDLLQLIAWLGLVLLWPGPRIRWGRSRVAAAAALALLTLFAKESWIILPGFVLVFDLVLSELPWRRAALRAGAAAIPAVVYTAIYFAWPPITAGSYYTGGFTAWLKVPHVWAAFLSLTTLRPVGFEFGPSELAGVACMLAMAWISWRIRSRLAAVGFAFFLLPFVPILPVGFLVTRYTAAPLAGFLMIWAALGHAVVSALRGVSRRAATVAIAVVVLLVQGSYLSWLRGDWEDWRRFDELHRRLLAQLETYLPTLPRGKPVVAVRLERENPLRDLALASAGVPKIYFYRGDGPRGLADWAALFSYALDAAGGPIYVDADEKSLKPIGDYEVVGYTPEGFVSLARRARSAQGELRAWTTGGFAAKLLVPWQP